MNKELDRIILTETENLKCLERIQNEYKSDYDRVTKQILDLKNLITELHTTKWRLS